MHKYNIGDKVIVNNVSYVAAECIEGDTGTIIDILMFDDSPEPSFLVKVDNPINKVNEWGFLESNLSPILSKGV